MRAIISPMRTDPSSDVGSMWLNIRCEEGWIIDVQEDRKISKGNRVSRGSNDDDEWL
jgi:hypothetical protein